MTVIAWDGMTLAADRRMCSGNTVQSTTKIRRLGRELLGVAGNLSVGKEMISWYAAGAKPAEFPASNRDPNEGCSLIVVRADGTVWKYESSPHPFSIEGPFAAFGCGDSAALVALACGKTASEAVALVSQFDRGCGNGVDSLELAKC